MDMDDKNAPHDRIRRILFSHSQLVEDLLRHFVAEDPGENDWLRDLDFATLRREHESSTEARRGGSPLPRRRVEHPAPQPAGWGAALRGHPDRVPIERRLVHGAPQDGLHVLLLSGPGEGSKLKQGDRLPAVLPVVIYNGDRSWRAPLSIEELVGPVPEPLQKYQPQFRYLLLDEQNAEIRLGGDLQHRRRLDGSRA